MLPPQFTANVLPSSFTRKIQPKKDSNLASAVQAQWTKNFSGTRSSLEIERGSRLSGRRETVGGTA